MPKVIFPYQDEPTTEGQRLSASEKYRPTVPVTLLAGNGESVRWLGLADSGADSCLFPLTLAPLLRLDLPSLAKGVTSGLGNRLNVTYFETITIDLGFGIIFTSLVGFTGGMNGVGFGLLGQTGLFENYDVTFARRRKIFIIERV